MNNEFLEREVKRINEERFQLVCKTNDFIQKSRTSMTLTQQKFILYAISKIKPTDTDFDEFTICLNDFYKTCGVKFESYYELKKALVDIDNKAWWIDIVDENGVEWESRVRWFSKMELKKNGAEVRLKFHQELKPYLLELIKDKFYTSYTLNYVLPFGSVYSIKLYELFKTYQNVATWEFSLEKLKKILLCTGKYADIKDFKARVIDKAISEINRFSDLLISYDSRRTGRKITHLIFYIESRDGISGEEYYITD